MNVESIQKCLPERISVVRSVLSYICVLDNSHQVRFMCEVLWDKVPDLGLSEVEGELSIDSDLVLMKIASGLRDSINKGIRKNLDLGFVDFYFEFYRVVRDKEFFLRVIITFLKNYEYSGFAV